MIVVAPEVLETATRYYYQLRNLKPVQIYYRLRKRIRPPSLTVCEESARYLAPPGLWVPPVKMPHRRVSANRFLILGQEKALSLPAAWQDRALGKKWLMELHTFNFLEGRSGTDEIDLIHNWIDNNTDCSGPGWHPYMTSQRISNWLKWGLSGSAPDSAVCGSIAQQLRYLLQVLFYDELDHKLFNNGKALVFAGLCLDHVDAGSWLKRGMALTQRFSRELVGDDGGYIGLSPMYHCTLLNDMLDVANLLQTFRQPVPDDLVRAITSATRWLTCMCHPDGQIALFNDAAFTVAPEPKQLHDYARRLGFPVAPAPENSLQHLDASGFVRIASGGAVALLDIGRIGPDHFPSHGHADTFTFELSLNGQRLFVDTGLSTYEHLPARLWERGTAAHNTVQVDGRNSSDVWQLFKVGRRARISGLTVQASGAECRVSATHDGYCRVLRPLLHRREWRVSDGELRITDCLTGKGDQHEAKVAFHLHPDIIARQRQANLFSLETSSGVKLAELELWSGLQVSVSDYDYHPEFGKSIRATRITGNISGCLPMEFSSRLSWLS